MYKYIFNVQLCINLRIKPPFFGATYRMDSNIIRTISNKIYRCLKQYIPKRLIGYYYQILHYIIILGGAFVILFNNDPYHLLILLCIISLDALANVVVHDCPLTALERKYLKSSLSHDRRKSFKSMDIMYKCNHIYESQVELIVNMWTMVACKIVVILAIRTLTPMFFTSMVPITSV